MATVERIRTGARTFLNLMVRACRLSHTPGFTTGVNIILGETNAGAFLNLWTPLCAFVETLVAADDFFNQRDAGNEGDGGEDGLVGI